MFSANGEDYNGGGILETLEVIASNFALFAIDLLLLLLMIFASYYFCDVIEVLDL